MFIPEHGCSLQERVYDEGPVQFLPLCLGSGVLQVLFVVSVPPPHSTLQALNVEYEDQPPFTVNS